MTIAYLCIIVACLLPVVCAGIAKSGGYGRSRREGGFDNAQPREWLAALTGWQARANAAQANSFEALPLFVARAGQDQFEGFTASIDRFITNALAVNRPVTFVNHATGPHAFDLFEDSETSREILSGWLVAAPSGENAQGIAQVPGGVVAWVDLRDFRARLCSFGGAGLWVYGRTQAVIHRRLSRAFLRHDMAPFLPRRSS